MFKGVWHHLEFDKILQITSELAKSDTGRAAILSIKPEISREKILDNAILTFEFVKFISEFEFPLEYFPDIKNILEKVKIEGAVLSPFEIISVLKTCEVSKKIKNTLTKTKERFQRLNKFSPSLSSFSELREMIKQSVGNDGEILDSASPNLKLIREKKREISLNIKKRLEALIRRNPDICPEEIITVRNGRYVILARTNYKNRFTGIIHDRSSSGQMVYVEPSFVIEENNRLRELNSEEDKEIKRILTLISKKIREQRLRIELAFSTLIEIDKLQAIGTLSYKFNGNLPEIGNHIYLKDAKHPLLILSDKQVIPVDITLKTGLVITGPNTGGKTVILKTVGLFTLMFQSGFLIPVSEGSKVKIFRNVMADIGDEQNIEQSLSTFGGHIKNIAEILKSADENTLVLLDELGAGTDPVEGSTLGISILEYLKEKKAKTVATTHFTPIKLYAYKENYYDIASVLFDEKSLKPLYKLAYGVIGKSYALIIAKRYGIPDKVTEKARLLLSSEDKIAAEILSSLEKEYKALQNEKEEMQKIKEEMQKKLNAVSEKEKTLREKGIEKLQKEIEKFKEESGKLLSQIKNESLKQKVKKLIEEETKITEQNRETEIQVNRLKIGMAVKMKTSGRKGVITEINRERKTAKVAIGPVKLEAKLNQLEVLNETYPKKDREIKVNAKRPERFFPEIKLLGMRGDEALEEVERFLDNANLCGIERVKIVHGHGTGILKRLIRTYLKESPYVKSFRSGKIEEGGDGVTIVEMK